MIKHYINLTNGIAAIANIPAGEAMGFVRIQSTTLEHKDWVGLFTVDVCADMLLHLALGWDCVLHDRGTNRVCSKTCYTGISLIRYVLNRHWYGLQPDVVYNLNRRGEQGHNVAVYYAAIYDSLTKERTVARRLNYFRQYAIPAAGIRLRGISESTTHDGDRAYHRSLLSETYSPL